MRPSICLFLAVLFLSCAACGVSWQYSYSQVSTYDSKLLVELLHDKGKIRFQELQQQGAELQVCEFSGGLLLFGVLQKNLDEEVSLPSISRIEFFSNTNGLYSFGTIEESKTDGIHEVRVQALFPIEELSIAPRKYDWASAHRECQVDA